MCASPIAYSYCADVAMVTNDITDAEEADENSRVRAGMQLKRECSSVVLAFAAGVMVTMAFSAAWHAATVESAPAATVESAPAATVESALAQLSISYSRMERLPRPAATVASALSQDRRPQQNKHMRMYLTPCLANVEDASMKVVTTSNKVGNPMKRSDKCNIHSCEHACIRATERARDICCALCHPRLLT